MDRRQARIPEPRAAQIIYPGHAPHADRDRAIRTAAGMDHERRQQG